MEQLQTVSLLQAPAKKVWDIISDFHGAQRWMPVVVKSVAEVAGNEPGALRTVYVGPDAYALDRLESIDARKMTFTYSILESTPLFPFKGYQATMSLEETPPNATTLRWSCKYLLRGDAKSDDVKAFIRDVYTQGVKRLTELLA